MWLHFKDILASRVRVPPLYLGSCSKLTGSLPPLTFLPVVTNLPFSFFSVFLPRQSLTNPPPLFLLSMCNIQQLQRNGGNAREVCRRGLGSDPLVLPYWCRLVLFSRFCPLCTCHSVIHSTIFRVIHKILNKQMLTYTAKYNVKNIYIEHIYNIYHLVY